MGDTLPLAFWPGFSRTTFAHGVGVAEGSESSLLEPVGRAEARVVGIGVFPDEVLLDGLYPRHRVVVTPDVAAPFDCTYRHPASDDPRPLEQMMRSIVPEDCSTAYQYFSLRVDGGDRGVGAVIRSLAERFTAENDRLPAALTAGGIGFDVIPTVTAEERQRVQRLLAPAVTALQLFGVGTAGSTIVVVVLGALRIARRQEEAAGIWCDLGATRATRMAGIVLPLAAATAVGLAGSLVVGWLTSALGPVASARLIEPAGRFGLSASVVLSVLGGSAVVLAAGLIVVAGTVSSCQRHAPPRGGSRRSGGLAAHSPSLTLGVRSAANGGEPLELS